MIAIIGDEGNRFYARWFPTRSRPHSGRPASTRVRSVPVQSAPVNEVVFLAVRIPKRMKRQLQQAALDEETSIQALVRRAVEAELERLAARTARRSRAR
jgi:hypothetical protein